MTRHNMTTFISAFFFLVVIQGCATLKPRNDFKSNISTIPKDVRSQMLNRSWNKKCPVTLDDLAYIKLTYWGFDGHSHEGVIVVHNCLAEEVVDIFRELYQIKFPIERIEPYEKYGPNKYAEMNDTTGFYFRPAQEDPTKYSIHSWGFSIDINPMVNPFLDKKLGWWPKGSEKYHRRDIKGKGKITLDSKVFEIFTRHGWVWGGLWEEPDYMHFEKGLLGSPRKRPLNKIYFINEMQYGISKKWKK